MKTIRILAIIAGVFFSGSFCVRGQDPFTNGLVAYYPFNGNANDESGNGNNASYSGAVLAADRFGVANKAFHFTGPTDT